MKLVKNSVYRGTWVPDHCDDLGPKVWNADTWQESLIHNVVRVVANDRRRIAIDCGANVGLTTIALRHYFDKVIAFEADPLNYECLLKNTDFLDNVECHNMAVADKKGTMKFKRHLGASGHSHYASLANDGLTFETFNIEADRLDTLEYTSVVDFIKLDVEGCETDALIGARGLIAQHRPALLVEIAKTNAQEFNRIYDILSPMGYLLIEKIQRDFLFIHSTRKINASRYYDMQKSDTKETMIRLRTKPV